MRSRRAVVVYGISSNPRLSLPVNSDRNYPLFRLVLCFKTNHQMLTGLNGAENSIRSSRARLGPNPPSQLSVHHILALSPQMYLHTFEIHGYLGIVLSSSAEEYPLSGKLHASRSRCRTDSCTMDWTTITVRASHNP